MLDIRRSSERVLARIAQSDSTKTYRTQKSPIEMSYEAQFHDESDADDEYERSIITSPTLPAGYESSSPTESDPPSNEHTPTTFTHSTVHAISPRGLITEWSSNQTADFIASLGLSSYRNLILTEDVSGEVLVRLSHGNLKDMNVNSVGHRLTILKAVYEVKLKQNISIEEDDYVPLSADVNAPDQHATQDDVARIIHQIKLRDERIRELEKDLYTMRDDVNRLQDEQRKLREDTLPALRAFKDRSQPLPTPDALEQHNNPLSSPNLTQQQDPPKSGGSIARRPSKKGWLGTFTNKMPSPTLNDGPNLPPSAAAMAASDHLNSSFNSEPRQSPHLSNQPSPTSPPYNTVSNTSRFPMSAQQSSRGAPPTPSDNAIWNHSNASTATQIPASSSRTPASHRERGPPSSSRSKTDAENDPTGFMKSFRVSMEEPCHKVLPVALKKYQIQDDPSQYSLYIVHGDEERCLGMDEKPLILFKQLANDGKKPMFMLRKHATPPDGFSNTRGASDNINGSGSGGGTRGASSNLNRVQSYANYNSKGGPLPGGVY
ncbi:MAG: hypothetical protein Q9162_000899 [Coniocarpon cinnabarinum]